MQPFFFDLHLTRQDQRHFLSNFAKLRLLGCFIGKNDSEEYRRIACPIIAKAISDSDNSGREIALSALDRVSDLLLID